MVVPGFGGRIVGRAAFLAGFQDFVEQAVLQEYREDEPLLDVVGEVAVVSYRYEMLYTRSGERWRATGRDMWVFARRDEGWIAVWRTMLDSAEARA